PAFGPPATHSLSLHDALPICDKPEEGGDDVKSSCPLCPGLHTCYNGRYRAYRTREGEAIAKGGPSSDRRLQLACVKPELLVIAEDRKSTRLNSSHVKISYAVF